MFASFDGCAYGCSRACEPPQLRSVRWAAQALKWSSFLSKLILHPHSCPDQLLSTENLLQFPHSLCTPLMSLNRLNVVRKGLLDDRKLPGMRCMISPICLPTFTTNPWDFYHTSQESFHSISYRKGFKLPTLLVTMETICWLYLTISYKKGIKVYLSLKSTWNSISNDIIWVKHNIHREGEKWLIGKVEALPLCKENIFPYILYITIIIFI